MADEDDDIFTHQERKARIGEDDHSRFARELYNSAGKRLSELEKAAAELRQAHKRIKKDAMSPLGGRAK